MSVVLYLLLGVVAVSAAVLSFDALLALALACGYAPVLAWMLPVVIDAGAAAGTLAWLARTGRARVFGRALALVLLFGSVAGNALGHALLAYEARPTWWLVAVVSAIPPTVLASVVHLAVLAGRATLPAPAADGIAAAGEEGHESCSPGVLDDRGLSRLWESAPPADDPPPPVGDRAGRDRAGELIASGAGRRRLARELDISEHAARELLAARRNGHHATTGMEQS